MAEPTYIFRDGNVYTYQDGKVVASVKESDFVDSQGAGHPVEMPPPPHDIRGDLGGMGGEGASCPTCGSPTSPHDAFCPQCGEPLSQEGMGGEADLYGTQPPVHAQPIAHVTTPNGLKGKVLGRTAALWGDEVTVRFENGRIVRLPVTADMKFSTEEDHKEASTEDPIESLETRLAAHTAADRDALVDRAKELVEIKKQARVAVAGATDEEAARLNTIFVTAEAEGREVVDAIQHIAELEGQAYEAPAPFDIHPVEQASLGGNDGSWLSATIEDLVHEADSTDYIKLMDEGPEVFVAELEPEALGDASVTRQIASRFIRSKTAGTTQEDVRDRFEHVWLHRVEDVRKKVVASQKEELHKEAKADAEPLDVPDEGLFL